MECVGEEQGWGRCHQRPWDGLCWHCDRLCGLEDRPRLDEYYVRKVMAGLITEPTLTEAEWDATMGGKYKGDGRRLDQYTPRTQVLLDPEGNPRDG